MNEEQNHFFGYWFQGFTSGLEQLDDLSREKLLQACGRACADSYTLQVFQEARQAGTNMQAFLEQLHARFPDADYTLRDETTIDVVYRKCTCDLVVNGWVRTPHLCACSAANLQANFSSVLEKPVQVKMLTSILGGNDHCSFEVTF